MSQHIARLLLTVFCPLSIQAHALETDKRQAMSQARGLAAGRQQPHVMGQMKGAVPADKAGLARAAEPALGATLAQKRELSLCNTPAVIGVMQRQRNEPRLKGATSPEQVEGMLCVDPEAKSMVDDTLALSWVDDEMKYTAIQRATLVAAEAPPRDVAGFRELAQQLTKDPLRLPYGNLCEALASGARKAPGSRPRGTDGSQGKA